MTTTNSSPYFVLFVKSSFTWVDSSLVQLLKKVSIFPRKKLIYSDRLPRDNGQLGILTAILNVDIRTVEFQSCLSYHKPVTSLLIDKTYHILRNVKTVEIFYFI